MEYNEDILFDSIATALVWFVRIIPPFILIHSYHQNDTVNCILASILCLISILNMLFKDPNYEEEE